MSTIRVPLLGRIPTGEPMPVPDADFAPFDGRDSVEISPDLLPAQADPGALFALEVQGSGMLLAGLSDCDIVVLQPVSRWDDGDILAVWLPERGEALLCRLFRDGEGYRLQPAASGLKPVLIPAGQALEVKGKVVAMIRTIRD